MFEHLGWDDAADDIVNAVEATIGEKIVTYDFARLMDGANPGEVLGVRVGHRRPALTAPAYVLQAFLTIKETCR